MASSIGAFFGGIQITAKEWNTNQGRELKINILYRYKKQNKYFILPLPNNLLKK